MSTRWLHLTGSMWCGYGSHTHCCPLPQPTLMPRRWRGCNAFCIHGVSHSIGGMTTLRFVSSPTSSRRAANMSNSPMRENLAESNPSTTRSLPTTDRHARRCVLASDAASDGRASNDCISGAKTRAETQLSGLSASAASSQRPSARRRERLPQDSWRKPAMCIITAGTRCSGVQSRRSTCVRMMWVCMCAHITRPRWAHASSLERPPR